MTYGEEHTLMRLSDSQSTLSFTHMVGKYGGYLYGFFEVTDPKVIYRGRNSLSVDRNDYLAIATLAPDGRFRRYTIANKHDAGSAPSSCLKIRRSAPR